MESNKYYNSGGLYVSMYEMVFYFYILNFSLNFPSNQK